MPELTGHDISCYSLLPHWMQMKNTNQACKMLTYLLALALLGAALPLWAKQSLSDYVVYVGTYTDKASKGIYSFHLNTASGKLTALELAAETENPSFITSDPTGRFLYAVNEIDVYQGRKTGTVSAYSIERSSGKL